MEPRRSTPVRGVVSDDPKRGRQAREPAQAPPRDARLIDRLQYQLNGQGFTYERPPNLWVVDIADGGARRMTSGSARDGQPAWSPDGTRIAFVSDRHPAPDLTWRTDVYLIDAEGGPVTRVSGGRGDRTFSQPTWSPDGSLIAATGHRFPAGNASANGLWLFAPRGEQAGHDLTSTQDPRSVPASTRTSRVSPIRGSSGALMAPGSCSRRPSMVPTNCGGRTAPTAASTS